MAERLTLPPEGLPEVINALTITLQHTPEATKAAVPEMVGGNLKDQFKEIRPLLAAGFAAPADQDSSRIKIKVSRKRGYITVQVSNAAHGPMLAWLLVRLVEDEFNTPPRAYERLVAWIGEEDAKDAFDPSDIAREVEAITVSTVGTGSTGHVIDLERLPFAPELESLAEVIDQEGEENMAFFMPSDAHMDEDAENGFLVLQNAGIFRRLENAFDDAKEPELWLRTVSGVVEMAVEGWTDEPLFLVEYIRVVAGGSLEGIAQVAED
ncbi:hypothetical protein [Hoeflea sp.]|uniref:hypothetical protein n=1 Tax=Hoeflea sp. TaxID=1940281 RepID=UPI003A94ADB8